MNRKTLGYILLIALVALPLAAKDKAVSSRWTSVPIKLDADPADWPAEELLFEEKAGARFSVKNDAERLYVFLSIEDPKFQSSIEQTGVTIWVNNELKDKKIHGLKFYRKTVTADQLIQQMEAQGQSLTSERKAEIKARPQYALFACDAVDKKGAPVPHPAGTGNGTFRTAQVQKAKVYEFSIPMALLDDPQGKMKVDPSKPFKVGFEWGGMTPEMLKERAARIGDQGAQANAAAARMTVSDSSGEGGGGGMGGGGSLASLRGGPKKFEFWFDLTMAPKQ